jgi:hypothetical protein
MTALGRQDVKRTFFAVGKEWTGLSRPDTHERYGQDACDFGHVVGRMRRHRIKIARKITTDPAPKTDVRVWPWLIAMDR